MAQYQFWFNVLVLAILVIALIVSYKSPNVRFLIIGITLIKIIDVALYDTIKMWGTAYYVIISGYDIAGILLIIKRQQIANTIANKAWLCLSQGAKKCADAYQLTSNEIGVILVYIVSIAVNIASIIERLIRDPITLQPILVYNAFPSIKFALSVIMLLIFTAVSINGARNIYHDIKAT